MPYKEMQGPEHGSVKTFKEKPMSLSSSLAPQWATSSLGLSADTTALDRASLCDHLVHCGASRGPLQMLGAGAGELHGLLAARVITSALGLTLLLGSAWLLL